MTKTIKELKERYQLRHVAGRFYLLDMMQTGKLYKRPMEMNEIGAEIWQMLTEGYTTEQVVQRLSGEYDADESEIRQDVLVFKKGLLVYGVEIGE